MNLQSQHRFSLVIFNEKIMNPDNPAHILADRNERGRVLYAVNDHEVAVQVLHPQGRIVAVSPTKLKVIETESEMTVLPLPVVQSRPVYAIIAGAFDAMLRCAASKEASHKEWKVRHRERIEAICKHWLPRGSGFDAGTKLDFDRSKPNKLVFIADHHDMNTNGFYCGWSNYKVIVEASLAHGADIYATGGKRDNRDYVGDTYRYPLELRKTSADEKELYEKEGC